MEIEKRLPFKHCDSCPEFILDIEQQTLFYYDNGSSLALIIRCKNERVCERLKKHLNDEVCENET